MGYATILIIIVSCHCFAQSTNTLKAAVLDQNADFVGKARALLTKDGEIISASVSSAKGVVIFSNLEKGEYKLKIEALGFKVFEKSIVVKEGANSLEVVLEVKEITENVSVELSGREKKFEEVITKIFTPEEINKLPANPKDIEKELKRRFGNNVVIKVDGFSGGKIPDKSQIASVKVVRNVFDAEFHDAGLPVVEIKTRAGGKEWSGSLSFSFADAALNARDAFADEKLPMNEHNISFALVPPSIGNNTSLYFSFSRLNNKTSREFIGLPPFEVSNQDLTKTVKSLYPVIRLTQNLSEYHTLYAEYAYYDLKERGLGLGWFDLPERAYSNDNVSHALRLSEQGIWGKFEVI